MLTGLLASFTHSASEQEQPGVFWGPGLPKTKPYKTGAGSTVEGQSQNACLQRSPKLTSPVQHTELPPDDHTLHRRGESDI